MKGLVGLFILFLLFTNNLRGQKKELINDRILVINSYSPVKEKDNHIISAFLNELSGREAIRVSVEYMDSESFPQYTHWVNWLNSLFLAYKQPPRLIVLMGEEVWSAYRNCCPENWKNIPVVLGGVKKVFIDYQNWPDHQVTPLENFPLLVSTFNGFKVSGYYINDYFVENLGLIRRLQPEVTDVAFYYDDRYHHQFLEPYLRQLLSPYKDLKIHFWFGSSLSTRELIDSITTCANKLAILSAGWYTDVNNSIHAYSMLQNELLRYPDKLIYELTDQDVSTVNRIGGYFVSGKDIGKDLAGLTYRVMKEGYDPAFGLQITPSAPAYYLNYTTFARRKLDKTVLPENIIWYNAPVKIWEVYSKEIVIFSVVFFFILLGISGMVLYKWKREKYYIKANRRLQHLLEVMPNMAVIFGPGHRILDIINPNEIFLMGWDVKDFIGLTMQELAESRPVFRDIACKFMNQLEYIYQSQEISSFNYNIAYQAKEYYAEARLVPYDNTKVIGFIQDITSRMTAEKEVIKYKNFLQMVIDHLPVGVFVKDPGNDFRYIYCNQVMKDFYATVYDDCLAKNDEELNHPLAELYKKEDQEVLESEHPISYRREIINSAGERKWAVTTKSCLRNDEGVYYIIAILVDITADCKHEMILENIKNELSIALDAGSLSAWNFEVETSQFFSLYNNTVSGTGITEKQMYDMLHPEDHEKYRLFMKTLIAGEHEKQREIFRFCRGKNYRWYETHATGIRSTENGQVVQIIGTEKDITEELLRQRELEESKFKTDFVIKSNGIIPWDYDVEKDFISSPYVDSHLYPGVSKDKFLLYTHPDDRESVKNALEEMVFDKKESTNIQIRVNFTGREYRWVDIHVVVFKRDKNGKVIQLTGLRTDITDWKNLTNELIMLRDKAEESNRLKMAFLANMSHEIRTPLNAIVGFSNLIAQTEDKAEVEEYCKIIETNNELLLRLISDILDLSKIEAGQLEFTSSEVCLSEFFANLIQMYQLRVAEGVELQCKLPDRDCVIVTEKNRVTQVMSNFLTNACKFTVRGYIRIGYEYRENSLRFFVSDTGKGIAKEHLPRIFDRFTKFDAFVQGTGLGLSICQTIINRLGGEIGVDSELGRGSTFWFTIPCEIHPIEQQEQNPEK